MKDSRNGISRRHALGQVQQPPGERKDRGWRADLVTCDLDDMAVAPQQIADEVAAIAKQPRNPGYADSFFDGEDVLLAFSFRATVIVDGRDRIGFAPWPLLHRDIRKMTGLQ